MFQHGLIITNPKQLQKNHMTRVSQVHSHEIKLNEIKSNLSLSLEVLMQLHMT